LRLLPIGTATKSGDFAAQSLLIILFSIFIEHFVERGPETSQSNPYFNYILDFMEHFVERGF
jgi:hypothetical protein